MYPPRRDCCQFSRNGRKTSRFDGRQTNVSATVPLHTLQRGVRSKKRRTRARGSGGEARREVLGTSDLIHEELALSAGPLG